MYNKVDRVKNLGAYLPDGRAFESKNNPDKNLYKFLDALAKSFVLFSNDLDEVLKEMNIETTEDLINRWEKEYGIPDGCLKNTGDLDERRQNLLIKIRMNGVQTVADFQALALKFGINIQVIAATDDPSIVFPLAFPWLFMTEQVARFTIIINLPEEMGENIFPFNVTKFPFPFSSSNVNIIECVFRKIVPANVDIIFRYIL